mmetsp:Transcript_33145/g.70667  ORF Transcript_33145/g.70667 Transcript_33145/m.70667 type:complete len:85 (+) Transcript_33145:54-308(+)
MSHVLSVCRHLGRAYHLLSILLHLKRHPPTSLSLPIAIARSVVGEVLDYCAFLNATRWDIQILAVRMPCPVHFHDGLKGGDGDV